MSCRSRNCSLSDTVKSSLVVGIVSSRILQLLDRIGTLLRHLRDWLLQHDLRLTFGTPVLLRRRISRSRRSLCPCNLDAQTNAVALDRHRPRPAADSAVLDHDSANVGVDIKVDPLATVRATNTNGVFHRGGRLQRRSPAARAHVHQRVLALHSRVDRPDADASAVTAPRCVLERDLETTRTLANVPDS